MSTGEKGPMGFRTRARSVEDEFQKLKAALEKDSINWNEIGKAGEEATDNALEMARELVRDIENPTAAQMALMTVAINQSLGGSILKCIAIVGGQLAEVHKRLAAVEKALKTVTGKK